MPENSWDQVSVCVITLNEEANLPRCLASVVPCGEIVVVDSGSTDRTREIAETYGAKWFVRNWAGFAKQRQFAEQQCTRDFVLFLDADEWLSDDLHREIGELLAANDAGTRMYALRRRSEFLGRQIRHGDWKNDWVTRLAPRGQTEWRGAEPHPYLASSSLTRRPCGSPLFHRPFRDLEQFRAKNEVYAALFAAPRGNRMTAISHSIWRFVRGYIFRAGFLDGAPGFILAREYSRMVHLKYAGSSSRIA